MAIRIFGELPGAFGRGRGFIAALPSLRNHRAPAGKWGGLFLGYLLQEKNASSTREIDAAFVSLLQKRADALIVSPDPLFDSRRVQLVTLATHHRLPTVYPFCENVEIGAER